MRARSRRAQLAHRCRAEGAPKASPTAPIRAQSRTGAGGSARGRIIPRRIYYSGPVLRALAPADLCKHVLLPYSGQIFQRACRDCGWAPVITSHS
ncbi:hypothetical protein NDU88_002048 [Pleurodeles waltl]|uniref:Uncharacterized protein n=1 Tax=Pleurodeles waltl TaxID=8319 RepID=A0AAV7W130_PLEWA|nr:hypothetical protein NDU88_002048 [Pleurodeles waltl]